MFDKKEYNRLYRIAHPDKVRKWRQNYKTANKDAYRQKRRRMDRMKGGASNPTGELRYGNCEICGRAGKLCYDHDHVTGAFRGWICNSCNRAMGLMGDDPLLLLAAVLYLIRDTTHIPTV